jgi:hypothetical protein
MVPFGVIRIIAGSLLMSQTNVDRFIGMIIAGIVVIAFSCACAFGDRSHSAEKSDEWR